MNPSLLEVNDIGASISRGTELAACSPGYALLRGKELVMGEEARAASRLHPQNINSRFWQSLSMDPLRQKHNRVRHHADLAYAHLLQLHQLAAEPETIIFAVPGHFTREQLSILLGIAAQCPFEAVGLVDTALLACASASNHGARQNSLYLDLQLHQCVITAIEHNTGLTRVSTELVQGAGLLALYDRCAHIIADAFIAQCRFDPLHSASSEQHIYDHLPTYLACNEGVIDIEIPQERSVHRARVERQRLVSAAEDAWHAMARRCSEKFAEFPRLLLGSRWAALPDLTRYAPEVSLLSATAIATAAQAYRDDICTPAGQGLSFVTSLAELTPAVPANVPASPPTTNPASNATGPEPSHLLIGNRALPLGQTRYLALVDGELVLENEASNTSIGKLGRQDGKPTVEPLFGKQLLLGGQELCAAARLAPGDELGTAGDPAAIRLIQVIADGEA